VEVATRVGVVERVGMGTEEKGVKNRRENIKELPRGISESR